jgi:hypothetical protein
MDNNRELENMELNLQHSLSTFAANNAPAVEEVEESISDEKEEQQQSQEVEEKKNSPQKSWKELREKAEQSDKLKKERDEYLALLQQIERQAIEYQNNQKNTAKEPEDDFDYNNLDDDEILTAKELKRSLSKEQKRFRKIEEELYMQQARNKEALIESELKAKHADLYDVLTNENITKLREARPSLAKSINLNPDIREKAMDTYQAIKDLGIYQSNINKEDKNKINQNSNKPRSSNSLSPQSGTSPLAKANEFASGLSKDRKEALYKEMKEKSGR